MQTINNRMTETQIADLFSLAVKLQVKAEESDDRDTAILAYSIQNACSNLTESQREFRAADATIHNQELKLTDMAVHLANAESKCRELAAENAGLKQSKPSLKTMMSALDEFYAAEDVPESAMLIAFNILRGDIETPDTDAFLAEVRAQGVEMFGEHVKAYNHSAGWQSKHFAAQIRKGDAHHCTHCGGIDTCSECGCTATDQMIERYRAHQEAAQ
ncbi:hypothetical protein [Citrobacter sp. Cpo126]|uniref:hypothetical protein n=1 Tax=Citrobacter sp. Cpo126 TaxID=2985148 RepID=UPI0025760A31|nr:hypothetical protein [Citrobacter sp. Cpo126]MDM2772822.1 hypothetical protein [Citrobacter sp. Cpo126]